MPSLWETKMPLQGIPGGFHGSQGTGCSGEGNPRVRTTWCEVLPSLRKASSQKTGQVRGPLETPASGLHPPQSPQPSLPWCVQSPAGPPQSCCSLPASSCLPSFSRACAGLVSLALSVLLPPIQHGAPHKVCWTLPRAELALSPSRCPQAELPLCPLHRAVSVFRHLIYSGSGRAGLSSDGRHWCPSTRETPLRNSSALNVSGTKGGMGGSWPLLEATSAVTSGQPSCSTGSEEPAICQAHRAGTEWWLLPEVSACSVSPGSQRGGGAQPGLAVPNCCASTLSRLWLFLSPGFCQRLLLHGPPGYCPHQVLLWGGRGEGHLCGCQCANLPGYCICPGLWTPWASVWRTGLGAGGLSACFGEGADKGGTCTGGERGQAGLRDTPSSPAACTPGQQPCSYGPVGFLQALRLRHSGVWPKGSVSQTQCGPRLCHSLGAAHSDKSLHLSEPQFLHL